MILHIPVQYLCSENNYHFSRFSHGLGREVASLLDLCLSFYATNVRLLKEQMKYIPAELVQQIYNHMVANNLLAPQDLQLFPKSMTQMTIDGSVENGEAFLASYCSVQRSISNTSGSTSPPPSHASHDPSPPARRHLHHHHHHHDHEHHHRLAKDRVAERARMVMMGSGSPPPHEERHYHEDSDDRDDHLIDHCDDHDHELMVYSQHTEANKDDSSSSSSSSNCSFDIIQSNREDTCENSYSYGEDEYHLHVLFGKSIQTSLFDLKEANMVTDLALDDFEDEQILRKLPTNLKHLSIRWCKLSDDDSLTFLNDYSHSLQSLRLSSVELKSLRFLSDLTSLTFLDLSVNSGIKDKEIFHLSKLSKLTTLDLDATGITSQAVPMITKAHPSLVCLNLSGTAVTSEGLQQALTLRYLKVVSVMATWCSGPYPSPGRHEDGVIIIGDYMTKQEARAAAQYSAYFSRAVQLRLIFGYYKLVANSRSRPHWPWFVQNILDMAKCSIRNEKLVEMALLFLWGEVCGEAMPEDFLNVAHKPVIASVTTICEYGGINTISKIMEYYIKNHRSNGGNVLLFAIGLLTVASHNNKMSQTLMCQNKIVPLVLDAFQTYEKTEPSFQKFVLGVLLQLAANVQCHAQISAQQRVVQMCVSECVHIKEYLKVAQTHKIVLALRSVALLYNLSCWGSNGRMLVDAGIVDCINDILSVNKRTMAGLLEASCYFDPLAIATLANLTRPGVLSSFGSATYTRWQRAVGLAIESFKELMRNNQLQVAIPANVCYEFCSINNWDLARSLIALFVNCLIVDPLGWGARFRASYFAPVAPPSCNSTGTHPAPGASSARNNSEEAPHEDLLDYLLQYALTVDTEGQILLSALFCVAIAGRGGTGAYCKRLPEILAQIAECTHKMDLIFPSRFCCYVWVDFQPIQSVLEALESPSSSSPWNDVVRRWCQRFLDAASKSGIFPNRPSAKRPVDAGGDGLGADAHTHPHDRDRGRGHGRARDHDHDHDHNQASGSRFPKRKKLSSTTAATTTTSSSACTSHGPVFLNLGFEP